MIITLCGLPGSGKSTVRNLLAEKLGLKKYSMGDMRGKMALDRGLTIDQLNELGMKESFTDNEVDQYQTKLGQMEDNFVIDGWLSWHFIPQSIKIFLEVDPAEGARRIFQDRKSGDKRNDEPEYKTIEEAQETLQKRIEQNAARYQKWYGLDYLDRSHYDLVVDTTNLKPEETLEKIVKFVKSTPPQI